MGSDGGYRQLQPEPDDALRDGTHAELMRLALARRHADFEPAHLQAQLRG